MGSNNYKNIKNIYGGKMKKRSRKALVKEADKWFSLYIREKTKQEYGKCPFCSGEVEQCFHFFSRANYITRWDKKNAIGSCAKCNLRMEFDPYPYFKWFIDEYGQFTLDELNRKHNKIAKYTNEEIEKIAKTFKDMYINLTGGNK